MNAPFAPIGNAAAEPGSDPLLLAPSLERRRLQSYLGILLADIVALFAGFVLGGFLYLGQHGAFHGLHLAQIALPVFLTVALYNGSYSLMALQATWRGIQRAQVALALSWAAALFFAFYTKASAEFSRGAFSIGVAMAGIAIFVVRMMMRDFVAWRCGDHVINQLVIDDGGPSIEMDGTIHVNAAALGLVPSLDDPHALDRFGLVLRNIDRVIVSCAPERRQAWSMMLKGANVDGEVLNDDVMRLGAHGARVAAGHGLLTVSTGPLGMRARAMKRLLDLGLAGLAGIILLPFLLLVALVIRLDDGGPALFAQRRTGRANRFFRIYKFRTMAVSKGDSDGEVSAARDDERVTRIGRFLRRTSIDELPQLFNVIVGDMSLVGPRPHAIGSQVGDKPFWEVDRRYWQRHSLKPGLSGLAQIRGYRGATDQESDLVDRLQSDLEYLEGWTIQRDIKIILLTLRVLVHDRAF